jgi:hypothetical protein
MRRVVIEPAAIAAPPESAKDATVVDREGHILKLGDNGRARGPIRPHSQETPPMCHEGVRMEWADAYLNEKAYADGMLTQMHRAKSRVLTVVKNEKVGGFLKLGNIGELLALQAAGHQPGASASGTGDGTGR